MYSVCGRESGVRVTAITWKSLLDPSTDPPCCHIFIVSLGGCITGHGMGRVFGTASSKLLQL